MDTADKATNKAMAIAFKYACFQVFCIPTEERKEQDPDAETPEPSVQKKRCRMRSSLKRKSQLLLQMLQRYRSQIRFQKMR